MDKQFSLEWTVQQQEDQLLLRDFLAIKGVSKRALTSIKFDGGLITVNQNEVTVRYVLKQDDHVKIWFPVEQISEQLKPEEATLDIVYEDDYVLVVNKPPVMNTIPSREHPSGSVANLLAGYYLKKGIYSGIHIVTRLDRDTSGAMLIAKHSHIHHLLSEMQKQKEINRTYEAIAEGEITQMSGTIDLPIARKNSSIIEREVSSSGKRAVTHYEVQKSRRGFSHLFIRLETGRTHQIRVHFSYLGYPLAGDDLYGGSREIISRQALHCRSVAFVHPVTGEDHQIFVPVPFDMQQMLTDIINSPD
ncbi:RluA family pseudouridine synthase [Jeotgalibacillus sp. R-1-5s-1]|uniref:RluA family pseudouridine synthase n=1 Tax=Jeotgalibacillus sp. R-1-5s-1 TaxID=2555897 RepID=UPI00106CDD85|nr:RluA family pseudouridine synthase [Jeotgalibacillus sp. R-1-5s-1]TFD97589.1 RluA family pseudouridine synthase [Jeotgalibacillus sp. R-1-5s-1]